VWEVTRGPFWAFVCIRAAFWLVTIVTLLWTPVRGGAIPPFGVGQAHLDLVFDAFAQKDAQWFVHIAQHGYDSSQSTAFFPLYPLCVAALAHVLGSTVVAGTILSLVAGGIGAVVVARIALDARLGADAVLYLALYPLAFVFTAVYSEGLFLALSAGAFLAAMRSRSLVAGVLAALACGTRPVGIALVVPLAIFLWPRGRSPRQLARALPIALVAAPFIAYAAYLHQHVGSATAFLHARADWLRHFSAAGPFGGAWDGVSSGVHGAAELLRHLPQQLGSPEGYPMRDEYATWNVLHLLLLALALWLTWVAWRRVGAAYGGYSAALLAIVLSSPAAGFPLASLPRYLLMDFPLFLALAVVLEGRPRARTVVLCTFAAVGALAAAAFAHNIWIA